MLFTNDDDPVLSNVNIHKRVITSASDMAMNSITLELIHFGTNFDVKKFYEVSIYINI